MTLVPVFHLRYSYVLKYRRLLGVLLYKTPVFRQGLYPLADHGRWLAMVTLALYGN